MNEPIWTDVAKVGDLVKLEVNALWRGRPTAWRTIRSVRTDHGGTPYVTVTLGGCRDYIVREHEIVEVTRRSTNA